MANATESQTIERLEAQIEDPTYYGDSENSATVTAGQLTPGVRIDGYPLGRTNTLVVQNVIRGGDGRHVRIEAADTADIAERTLHADHPIDAWGTL